jgi:hypothetical protein
MFGQSAFHSKSYAYVLLMGSASPHYPMPQPENLPVSMLGLHLSSENNAATLF